MAEESQDSQMDDVGNELAEEISQGAPIEHAFMAPSISRAELLSGTSYTHHSPIPQNVAANIETECVLGVDEAGRGPVLGPMVYALLYLPLQIHRSLLADTHHFDDSKVLTPAVRSRLMQTLCTTDTDLHKSCGWATRVMSARDISAAMMQANGTYNLNAQAMDATINLIKEVFSRGVNVTEIYIDTIGSPVTYQKKLEKIFPTVKITVAKKADSLYPCVSAASVCAKVTRDAALEVSYEKYHETNGQDTHLVDDSVAGWGSGYPSDARCTNWLKSHMDPVFGWGTECRFSWGTAKDMLESPAAQIKIDWPDNDQSDGMKVTDFFTTGDRDEEKDELASWFGTRVTERVF